MIRENVVSHFSDTSESSRKHKSLINKTKKYSALIHNQEDLFFLKYVCISNDGISSKTSNYSLRDLKDKSELKY